MALVIRPLRQRRRTTQRGKPMKQSQRWGKVKTMTPQPEGIISTSTGPVNPDAELDAAILEADAEEVIEVDETQA